MINIPNPSQPNQKFLQVVRVWNKTPMVGVGRKPRYYDKQKRLDGLTQGTQQLQDSRAKRKRTSTKKEKKRKK